MDMNKVQDSLPPVKGVDLTKVRLDKGEVVKTKLPGDEYDPGIRCMIHTDNTVYMMDMNNKSIKIQMSGRRLQDNYTVPDTGWYTMWNDFVLWRTDIGDYNMW